MPNKTVYKSYPSTGRGTINDGTTDLQVNFATQRVAISGYVQNFDTANDLTLKINSKNNNVIVLKAGTSFVFEDEYIDSVFISNASGAAVQYQAVIVGG